MISESLEKAKNQMKPAKKKITAKKNEHMKKHTTPPPHLQQ
jgi:hypothetical protein